MAHRPVASSPDKARRDSSPLADRMERGAALPSRRLWEVQSSELTMQPARGAIISTRGGIGRRINAQIDCRAAIGLYGCHICRYLPALLTRSLDSHALKARSVVMLVLASIKSILRHRAWPQVGPPAIQTISVDVINMLAVKQKLMKLLRYARLSSAFDASKGVPCMTPHARAPLERANARIIFVIHQSDFTLAQCYLFHQNATHLPTPT